MPGQDFWTGGCPKCGASLQIPASLKQFSCMYCGARLTPEELVTEPAAAPVSPVDGEACAAYYRENILSAVASHEGLERAFTKADYEPAFTQYSLSIGELVRQLDQAAAAGSLTADAAAAEFLNQLERRWAERGRRRAAIMERDKFIIAIFLVPAIRKMTLAVSEPYCQSLQSQWCRRYPKSPFSLGDYDDIVNGFRKKYMGLCFITTAVCMAEGKPDNCPELTAFRSFRDGYLRSCPDGPALIEEYYQTAPGIAARIELSPNRAERYAAIRRDYLTPCYADIQAGRLAQCKDRYVKMVRALEMEYLGSSGLFPID